MTLLGGHPPPTHTGARVCYNGKLGTVIGRPRDLMGAVCLTIKLDNGTIKHTPRIVDLLCDYSKTPIEIIDHSDVDYVCTKKLSDLTI